MEEFRDTLQERNLPITTMFFQMRKLTEDLKNGKIDRKDANEQVSVWKEKVEALNS